MQSAPVSSSLAARWAATVGAAGPEGQASPDDAPEASPLKAADVSSFAASLEGRASEWAQLFSQVPTQHERRKDALGGAIKIKSANKRLEKIVASLAVAKEEEEGAPVNADGGPPDGEAGADGGAPAAASAPALTEAAVECQAVLHEVVLGLLELTFPIHEAITQDDFKDEAAAGAAKQRMQDAAALTRQLGDLFAKGRLEPKAMKSGSGDDPLAPQVLKMLEKSVNKQKKKDKKKGGASAVDPSAEIQKAARALWESTQGRCSRILGEEVWEGLGWHRGLFLFSRIRLDVERLENDGEAVSEATPADGAAAPPAPAMFVDAMRGFRSMLDAQGPVPADLADPVEWQAASDGPHQDQTARMHFHGIYTSTHLRALKYLSELSYWRWKHAGRSTEDARMSALLNRKFVHVVRHIMPGVGWTADVEYDRILEMEAAALSSSEFSSGLGAAGPPPAGGAASKPAKKA